MEYLQKTSCLQNEVKDDAKQILEMMKNITPQFYKNKKEVEIVAELNTIQYLIKDVPQDILSKMCELSVKKYPKRKIENESLVFNLEYILSFYEEAKFLKENDLTSLEELWDDIETLEIEKEHSDNEESN